MAENEKPSSRKAVVMFGGLGPSRGACCSDDRHIGPFRARPDMDRWLAEMEAEVGPTGVTPLPQYDCLACGSTRGFTPEQLRGAA